VKILLDECVDQRFRHELAEHSVATVQEAGWAGKKNGELLALASHDFEVFITVDRNLYFQQNIPKFNIAVAILSARANRLVDPRPLVASLLAELSRLKPGQIAIISK
jgi:predicted nuclease of predicted toxin-antitoxin system